MITLSQLMQRVGVGIALVPFVKFVVEYFSSEAAREGAASSTHAAVKCAPLLCLVPFALLQPGPAPEQKRYAGFIATGLSLSVLGDGLLVFPAYFVAGMGAFAAAHLAYLAAFGFQPLRPRLGAACYVATAVYLPWIDPPGVLKWLVPPYALLLASMAWRALVRGGCAGGGALLFLLSDALLAYNMFGKPLPHTQLLVMTPYYLGQLLIAISVVDLTPRDAPAEGPEPAPAQETAQ